VAKKVNVTVCGTRTARVQLSVSLFTGFGFELLQRRQDLSQLLAELVGLSVARNAVVGGKRKPLQRSCQFKQVHSLFQF